MAVPDQDAAYSASQLNQHVHTRGSSTTGWFVGIVVAVALLAIGYLVFSASSGPATNSSTTINNTPAVTAPADTSTQPMNSTSTEGATMAPATSTDAMAPAAGTTAPAESSTSTAPAVDTAPAAPATTSP
jgi:cytoskeletal protein RodZ